MNAEPSTLRSGGWILRTVLWIVAFLLMAGAAVYQKKTGPTWPLAVSYTLSGTDASGSLVRSGTTGEDAVVALPALPEGWTATLHWRRFPTQDERTAVSMRMDGDQDTQPLVAHLPSQPAAGKVEYHVVFDGPGGESVRVPSSPADDPVLRFKDHVPLGVLLPHILVMFLSMMVGVRAALAACFRLRETRVLARITLAGLTIGGLVLGPIAQKLAFGEYWTGWPNDNDLTDNKALIMWLVWLTACLVVGGARSLRFRSGRVAVMVAGLVMLVVYLIPHSLRGSELDYDQLRQGVAAEDAIRTG